jgi:hypothetical protein
MHFAFAGVALFKISRLFCWINNELCRSAAAIFDFCLDLRLKIEKELVETLKTATTESLELQSHAIAALRPAMRQSVWPWRFLGFEP